MKKTLVAMAALAAVSAFAQSSVTLYGRIDNWFGQTRTQAGNAASVSNLVVNSGGHTGPRWGLRGSEDLGGGLKANFTLESGYSADTGAGNSAGLFNRQSWVGVSGGFGELKLGRTTTPMDEYNGTGSAHVALDIFANKRNGLRGSSVGVGGGFDARFNNGIKYDTPNFGGFTAKVHLGLGEGKTGPGVAAGNDFGLGAGYANGPLAVNLVHQQENDTNTATKAEKYTSLNASYDFGVVALSGAVDNDSQGTGGGVTKETYRGYSIGVTVPIGAAKIGFGYTRASSKVNSVNSDKGTGLGLVAEYSLSKRTRVYGGLGEQKTKTATGTKLTSAREIAVGVRHDF
jgi:predicted porin